MTSSALPALPALLTDRRLLGGVGAMVVTTSLWGLVFLGPELAPGVPAPLLAGLRYAVHGLACLVLLRRVADRGATPPWGRAVGHALAGFVGYYLLITMAVRTGGSALVVVLMSVSPVVLTLAGRPGVPLRRLVLPSATIVVGGVLATTSGGLATTTPGTALATALLVTAAIATWTWYAIDNERVVARDDLDLARWTATTGVTTGLVSLPLVAWGMSSVGSISATLTPTVLGVVVLLGVGCTTLASRTWNAATRTLGSSRTGSLLVLEPLFGLAWAHALAGVWPDARTLLGEVVLLAGAAATLRAVQPALARRRATGVVADAA